ncbi:hypothetical protein Angca_000523, partial [Angiostrongylus cantonensis]
MNSVPILLFLMLLLLVVVIRGYQPQKNSTWRQRTLSWTFRDPFKLLNEEKRRIARSLLLTAFAMWEEALEGRLKFKPVPRTISNDDDFRKPSDVDIDIFFAKGDHGDME